MDKELEHDKYFNKFIDDTYLIVGKSKTNPKLYIGRHDF